MSELVEPAEHVAVGAREDSVSHSSDPVVPAHATSGSAILDFSVNVPSENVFPDFEIVELPL